MPLNNSRRLIPFFKTDHEIPTIELAYIFGSCVVGKEGPMSDYDIAVLFAEMPGRDRVSELSFNISKHLMADRIDLLVLNRAPVELQYAVIADGELIYQSALSRRVEFEGQTLSFYGDYLPILRQQRRDILGEKNHETGIQRYRTALGQTQRLLEKIRSVHTET